MPPPTTRRSGRQFRQARLLLVLAVLVGTAVAVYAGHRYQIGRQAPALLERGRAAVAEKSWKAAIDSYTQYLRLRPKEAVAHAERADAYLNAGRPRDALQGYLDALAHDGDRIDARRKLAELYHAARRPGLAREHLDRLVGSAGKTTDPMLYLMLADCDYWDKKPADERKHLEAAVALPGAPAVASYRLADRIRTHDKTPRAIADADAVMNKLVTDRKADLEARLLRAAYRRQYGDKLGAKADLEFALRDIPEGKSNPRVIAEYVELLRADGELAAAEGVLRQARAANPADITLTLQLAEVLFQSRDVAKAKEARDLIRDVSAALPDGDGRLLRLGDTLIDTGDPEAARAAADRLAKVAKNRPLAAYLTGRLALLAGDWPAARADLLAALPDLPKTAPDNVVTVKAHLALANAHAAAHDYAAQLDSARAALALSPSWVDAKLVAADALIRTDKRTEAADLLRPNVATSTAARVVVARMRFADVLAQPSSPDAWRAFEAAAGSAPYPIEIVMMTIQARIARGDTTVLTDLEAELKKSPAAPRLWLALVGLRADRDPAAARDALDKAVAALGDRADLRLARAALLARDPKPLDPTAISKLAADTDKFSKDERVGLFRGLADFLAGRGFRAEAIKLVKDAAALRPFDLGIRLYLFDLANASADADATTFAQAEIRRLDGAEGPMTRVALVSREIAATPNPTAVQLDEWRTQLAAAVAARDGWSRPHALLGELAKRDKKPEDAVNHYQKAIDRGGAGEHVVRAAVELLLTQQKYENALRLMADLERSGGLSPALRNQFLLLKASSGEDPARALPWVRSPEMANSENYRDHLLRSFVFMMHNQHEDAKAALNKALAKNNTAPDVWLARVRYLVATGARPEAVNEVGNAARRVSDPADPLNVPLTLGRCWEMVGYPERAEAEYRKAAEANRADRRPVERLYELYRRTPGRGKDAEALLAALADKDDANGKWARRRLALARIGTPEGFGRIAEAVALIDRNTADGSNDVEDVRAKAFVQAVDPFQRKDALAALAASLARGPMAPWESLHFARMCLQAGQPEEAERLLVGATSGGPLVAPEHLTLLARVQAARGDWTAAWQTVDRLKLLDPQGWDTAVESARLLARSDKPAAARVLLAHKLAADQPEFRVAVVARVLEEFGCPEEARPLYEKWYQTETRKDRHLPLAQFLIRRKQGDAAIDLALKHAVGPLPGFTARLLAGAVRSRHAESVPAAEREAWKKRVDEASKWVAEKGAAEPNSPDFLMARAELADARGEYAEAARLYGLAADRTESAELKANLKNNRAWLLAVAEKDGGDEPLRLLNEAIIARGPMPFYLDTRAIVRLAARQPQEALADLDVAVAADAKPTYHFHRALAFDRLNKPVERDTAVALAVKRGLVRDELHPLEWPDYDRLVKK